MTESFGPGRKVATNVDSLLSTLYSLLEDLMFLEFQTRRNWCAITDILGELKNLAESADFA